MRKFFCLLLCFCLISSLFAKESYRIGDIGEGGGIVFYHDEDGFKVYDGMGGYEICHYLEMSYICLGSSQWLPDYVFVGFTRTEIGYGKANTYRILETVSHLELDKENCAAYKASQYYSSSTEGEWFLPSYDELRLIYDNAWEYLEAGLRHGGGGGYSAWSSSQIDKERAFVRFSEMGGYDEDELQSKDYWWQVWAVHAF